MSLATAALALFLVLLASAALPPARSQTCCSSCVSTFTIPEQSYVWWESDITCTYGVTVIINVESTDDNTPIRIHTMNEDNFNKYEAGEAYSEYPQASAESGVQCYSTPQPEGGSDPQVYVVCGNYNPVPMPILYDITFQCYQPPCCEGCVHSYIIPPHSYIYIPSNIYCQTGVYASMQIGSQTPGGEFKVHVVDSNNFYYYEAGSPYHEYQQDGMDQYVPCLHPILIGGSEQIIIIIQNDGYEYLEIIYDISFQCGAYVPLADSGAVAGDAAQTTAAPQGSQPPIHTPSGTATPLQSASNPATASAGVTPTTTASIIATIVPLTRCIQNPNGNNTLCPTLCEDSLFNGTCASCCSFPGPAPACQFGCFNDGDALNCTHDCFNNGTAPACLANCSNTNATQPVPAPVARRLPRTAPVATCGAETDASGISWPSAKRGRSVVGSCRAGYSGNPTRTCGMDGQWRPSNSGSGCQRSK